MFSAYTPIENQIGKEVRVKTFGEEYLGMLSGIYTTNGMSILVVTPMNGAGTEHHIPMASAVVTIRNGTR